MRKAIVYFLFLFSFFGFLINCSEKEESTSTQLVNNKTKTFLNLSDSAKYVGIETCKSCHQEIYESFIETGMGSSFDSATITKTSGVFNKNTVVKDPHLNFDYHPFLNNSQIYINEFRLKGRDTIYSNINKVDYIIGSGQHTNSHLQLINGYLFQMPLTFYTQKKIWDLPPGFENNNNARFTREIEAECLTCHNAYPKQVIGSNNKYTFIPKGIDCERCHGPGSIHVTEKRKGKFVNTKTDTDFTIVNPKKLSFELQVNLCQRCHLQGNAVLEKGKTFYDFKPGMKLSDVFSVFTPRTTDTSKFIMASHADRLSLSKCFTVSNTLNCITCHNPHKSVKTLKVEYFNDKCQSCHNQKPQIICSDKRAVLKDASCTKCHMPKSSSIDIPHVTVTDHYIQRKPQQVKSNSTEKFIGLYSINNKYPSNELKAKAYLQQYEKFERDNSSLLDSAYHYIKQVINNTQLKLHYYFLKENYTEVIQLNFQNQNLDYWSYYRIGEAYYKVNQIANSIEFYKKAIELQPNNLEIKQKLGIAYQSIGEIDKSKWLYEEIIVENPSYFKAYTNLGFIHLNANEPKRALFYYEKALLLDPDNNAAQMNMAGYYIFIQEYDKAKEILRKNILLYPSNSQAIGVLRQINSIKK